MNQENSPHNPLKYDHKLPEKKINTMALRMAFFQKVMSGCGALAFIWATVVLLGGFSTLIKQKDFWFVTIIVFMEATCCHRGARVQANNHKALQWLSIGVAAPETKPPKKRPRASRRPPTTVLTTDTSNFRAMVQEFTGFPAPPFAVGPSPFVRPRLLGGASAYGSPFLVRPCPLKYPQQNPALLSSIGTCTTTGGGANSLMHALTLLARSNAMPSTPADVTTARGSGSADQYGGHHGHGMGDFNFNPFDDFETETSASAEGDKAANGDHAGFFSSLGGAGDKYDQH
ncbi:hypothetical protein TRIUR3_13239 [Triticum urartu]|uniref:Uncharacterized protein n=1 Tax=Triticum urartu TaxID=4572 RepID=M7ZFI3_TRIUA|nr:hypothetical protein TRIUR3_13239 [Triticum urartu]